MNQRREPADKVGRRSSLSWIAISCRLVAALGFASSLIVEHGIRWVLVAISLGLLAVPLALRKKARAVTGALWFASADLLEDQKKFPGELSLMSSAVTWIPSSYSRHLGKHEVNLSLTSDSSIQLQSGPALLDVLIDVTDANGQQTRFLTHRSSRLRHAMLQIGPEQHT
jgi:hypothetical protein